MAAITFIIPKANTSIKFDTIFKSRSAQSPFYTFVVVLTADVNTTFLHRNSLFFIKYFRLFVPVDWHIYVASVMLVWI